MAEQKQTKTVLSFTKETPLWAKWVFRVVFAITGVAAFVIASDPGIPDGLKVRLGIYLVAADRLVYALSKGFGVSKIDKDNN